jgi:hypothetical protein
MPFPGANRMTDIDALIERLEATIHQINGHWWNRRIRPTAPDIHEAIAALRARKEQSK